MSLADDRKAPAPASDVRSQFFVGCSVRSWPGASLACNAGVSVIAVLVMPSGPVIRALHERLVVHPGA